MKKKVFLTVVLSFFVAGCSGLFVTSGYYNEVRFTRGIIHSVNRDIVTLSDGTVWKTDRILTTVNMSPVFLVIRETLDEGFLYVDGFKYRLNMAIPDIERIQVYSFGYLDLIKELEKNKAAITLFQGEKFYVRPQDIPEIESWGAGPEIILNEDRNFIINPRTMTGVPVIEIPPPADERIK